MVCPQIWHCRPNVVHVANTVTKQQCHLVLSMCVLVTEEMQVC